MKLFSTLVLFLLPVALFAQTKPATPPSAAVQKPVPGQIEEKNKPTDKDKFEMRDLQLEVTFFQGQYLSYQNEILNLKEYRELSLKRDAAEAAAKAANDKIQQKIIVLNSKAGCVVDLSTFERCSQGPTTPQSSK